MKSQIPTSQRLVLAAIPLIWRNGFSAVSVDMICREAGAHKGSFYHAFPSKNALLTSAIETVWNRNRAELRDMIAQATEPLQKLDKYLDWTLLYQRRMQRELGFVPGHFHMAIDITAPEAVARSQVYRAEGKALLAQVLRDVLKDWGASTDLMDWLIDTINYIGEGLLIEARLSNSIRPVEALKPTVMRLIEEVAKKRLDRSVNDFTIAP